MYKNIGKKIKAAKIKGIKMVSKMNDRLATRVINSRRTMINILFMALDFKKRFTSH